jgi:hypothetical protein
MKPTSKQIKDEIKKLTAMKPKVLRHSMFGDDHHHAIDKQIEVLGHLDEFFDEEEIERIGGCDEEDWASNVMENALYAFQWADGQEVDDGAPSEGWKSLVQKVK